MQSITHEDQFRFAYRHVLGEVAENPRISGVEIAERLAAVLAHLEAEEEHRTCRCGRAIVMPVGATQWVHDTRDRERGCRAATFTSSGGWDDSNPRSWTAKPAKP
ncbi:hypothetical protein Lfu02_36340 [Longispora fulva]|uniref:Uncharacterized protein n=1 Tax=Longispora fulva TaxID=619741 RepID=A0A8J7KKS4_9ACTN|nr:hypothetical protein [Longispora fulva]GIG59262.1 hypothetical protein Lfu02_36340 [Longispora fulva]